MFYELVPKRLGGREGITQITKDMLDLRSALTTPRLSGPKVYK